MVLSNTATPKYYEQFREAVKRGEIRVCQEVSLQMNRIDALIADPYFYYDDLAVEGFVKFCEAELTLTDGSDLELLPTFKLWAEDLLGWYYFKNVKIPERGEDGSVKWVMKTVKKRLIERQYLIVARGAAKSMYAECVQAYFLVCDPSTTHQITTAPTMKQAEEVMSPFRTAIVRARGPVFKFFTFGSIQNTTGNRDLRPKLASTKRGIENFHTNSLLEIRPMTINKLQGLRPKISTVDEWLSGDIREDVISAIDQGASKLDDWIILAISSEGTVRNGAGDTMKMELAKILKNEYIAPHVSIWHYKLDNVQEVADPNMWVKAQPNIGITVDFDTYAKDVERAEKAPAARNDILAKRFGIPMEGLSYFFTWDECQPHLKRDFWQVPCAMGADLSQGDDFCAFTFLFPLPRERFGVKTRSYISEVTFANLPAALKFKYQEFINQGTLQVMEGTVLDMPSVCADLERWIDERRYDVRVLGYDPYNSKEFLEWYNMRYGTFGIEKVIQGARTESVPLGELKKLAMERLLIFDEAQMCWTMGNAVTQEDTNGNRKLVKMRNEEKIDNVSALMDAWIAWKAFKEALE